MNNTSYGLIKFAKDNKCEDGMTACPGGNFCAVKQEDCPITDFKIVRQQTSTKSVYIGDGRFLDYSKDGAQPVTSIQWGYELCLNRSLTGNFTSSSDAFVLTQLQSWPVKPCTPLGSFNGDDVAIDVNNTWLTNAGQVRRYSMLRDNMALPTNYPRADDVMVSLIV